MRPRRALPAQRRLHEKGAVPGHSPLLSPASAAGESTAEGTDPRAAHDRAGAAAPDGAHGELGKLAAGFPRPPGRSALPQGDAESPRRSSPRSERGNRPRGTTAACGGRRRGVEPAEQPFNSPKVTPRPFILLGTD